MRIKTKDSIICNTLISLGLVSGNVKMSEEEHTWLMMVS
jgi:hypothetical protein